MIHNQPNTKNQRKKTLKKIMGMLLNLLNWFKLAKYQLDFLLESNFQLNYVRIVQYNFWEFSKKKKNRFTLINL
jgi:hypothetical protein